MIFDSFFEAISFGLALGLIGVMIGWGVGHIDAFFLWIVGDKAAGF